MNIHALVRCCKCGTQIISSLVKAEDRSFPFYLKLKCLICLILNACTDHRTSVCTKYKLQLQYKRIQLIALYQLSWIVYSICL